MRSKILFSERQKFRQWWLWVIFLGISGLFLWGVSRQIIGGQPFGDKPMSNTGLLATAGLVILLTLLFLNARLDTIIKEDGIYVRFFPFQVKWRHYGWKTLHKVYIRKYSPLAEYGGWGVRFGLFGKGRALNVSGNNGLQLEFTNGRKLLIGTNKPGELAEALGKIQQLIQ